LLSPISVNRCFDLTGAEALSADDVFRILEKITNRRVTVVQATVEEWEKHSGLDALSEGYVTLWRAHITAQREGWFGGVSNAVEELTGTNAISMLEYLPRYVVPRASREYPEANDCK
jgi:hypothetical protein